MNSGNLLIPQSDISNLFSCDERMETELMFLGETWLPERPNVVNDLRCEDKSIFRSIVVVVFK